MLDSATLQLLEPCDCAWMRGFIIRHLSVHADMPNNNLVFCLEG